MIGVGDRCIIEVTTDDDGIGAGSDGSSHRIRLARPHDKTLFQLAQHAPGFLGISLLFSNGAAHRFLLLLPQKNGLQVHVEYPDGVVLHHQIGPDAPIATVRKRYHTLFDHRVSAEHSLAILLRLDLCGPVKVMVLQAKLFLQHRLVVMFATGHRKILLQAENIGLAIFQEIEDLVADCLVVFPVVEVEVVDVVRDQADALGGFGLAPNVEPDHMPEVTPAEQHHDHGNQGDARFHKEPQDEDGRIDQQPHGIQQSEISQRPPAGRTNAGSEIG